GFSGGNTDRPALQRLLDDMRAGKVDVIVVYKELPRVGNCILCPRLSQYMTPRIARSRSMKPRLTGFGVVLPTASKPPDVEIAQVRDLVVERRSIRQCRTDHHAWHGTQAAQRREGREANRAALL